MIEESKTRVDDRVHLLIFWNSLFILLLIYILYDMILKMNKFVIQWRKFELKRSYIKGDMNF